MNKSVMEHIERFSNESCHSCCYRSVHSFNHVQSLANGPSDQARVPAKMFKASGTPVLRKRANAGPKAKRPVKRPVQPTAQPAESAANLGLVPKMNEIKAQLGLESNLTLPHAIATANTMVFAIGVNDHGSLLERVDRLWLALFAGSSGAVV